MFDNGFLDNPLLTSLVMDYVPQTHWKTGIDLYIINDEQYWGGDYSTISLAID